MRILYFGCLQIYNHSTGFSYYHANFSYIDCYVDGGTKKGFHCMLYNSYYCIVCAYCINTVVMSLWMCFSYLRFFISDGYGFIIVNINANINIKSAVAVIYLLWLLQCNLVSTITSRPGAV